MSVEVPILVGLGCRLRCLQEPLIGAPKCARLPPDYRQITTRLPPSQGLASLEPRSLRPALVNLGRYAFAGNLMRIWRESGDNLVPLAAPMRGSWRHLNRHPNPTRIWI